MSVPLYQIGQTLHVVPMVTGGKGLSLYHHWMFNGRGEIAMHRTYTNDMYADFEWAAAGTYLVRVQAADFMTRYTCDSVWFDVW